jgi:cell shape-determining protein MreD
MSKVLWAAVILLVVPVQVTVLQHAAIGEVRPDLCLVLACLAGYLRGERHGLLAGLAVGFLQDLASVNRLWLNLLTKAAAGLVAGMVGRQLVKPTALSFLGLMLAASSSAGLLFLFTGQSMTTWGEAFLLIKSALLPQAAYDAIAGAGLCWLLARRIGEGDGEAAGAHGSRVLSIK